MADPRIPLFDVRLRDPEVAAVVETLRSGWLTMGPKTEQFEDAFAVHLGVNHAIALCNATAALHLAYLAARIGPGDEVIVPAITFVATASAVRFCGATPVLADVVGQRDLSIDPADVASRVTKRTKAVCAMHYAGYPAAIEDLSALCEDAGLALIEDSAHAPSATARFSDRSLGTFGLAGAFSFFSNKVLGCGEGGLLATNDTDVADFVRSRRSHAMTSGTWQRHQRPVMGYDVVGLGFNYRMDEPRAALLLARMASLGTDVAERRRLTHRYRLLLRDVPSIVVPYEDADVDRSSCYVMPIMVEDPALQRPLRELLLERFGVQTSHLYPAIHEFTAYHDAAPGGLPRSELASRTQITIPLYPHLSEEDQDFVVRALVEGIDELTTAGNSGARTRGS